MRLRMNEKIARTLVAAISMLCIMTSGCMKKVKDYEVTADVLKNEFIQVGFNKKGLVSIYDKQLKQSLLFSSDQWSFSIENNLVESQNLSPIEFTKETDRIRYLFAEGEYDIEVVYELKPGWCFVSKQLFITNRKKEIYTINAVNVFHGRLNNLPKQIYVANLGEKAKKSRGLGDFGAFVRMNSSWGGMFLVQNPFFEWEYQKGDFSMEYQADMPWKTEYGPFASDRACIGTYNLTGQLGPGVINHHGSWLLEPEWSKVDKKIDMGEVDVFIECVRAFLLYKPEKSARIHVPWCENDYQIDVATEYGEAQYKRIVNTAAALGVEHMLYTVRNTDIALAEDASDNWHWEHLLWLNMGIQIRKNYWDPKKDILPKKTMELMDYARSKNINLMAYVYPTLEFQQNKVWLTQRSKNNPQIVASFGVREFQDWFIDNLIAFKERTGLSGYAFDYWSMKVSGTSLYAQWYGGRWVLEELRKRVPDIVIDGRQQYHGYGPWTWLAGTYPHPTGGDEQPESFESFPDLHFDRSSASHQRLTTYWYRNIQFCPTEIMPGFITHQTARKNADGDAVRDRDLNLRDWDYLGWKFSLISSVATAPFAHCVNMIPARDLREYEIFSKDTESQQFMRNWFDWTDRNAKLLKNLRSIIGPPAIGRVDGTAAIDGDHGFIFLFNPNHRKIKAEFFLDKSIGLTESDSFTIKQIYPEKDKYIGAPEKAIFNYGDKFSMMMDGTTAWVLEVQQFQENSLTLLFNVGGNVEYENGNLILSNIQGEVGTKSNIQALLPGNDKVKQVTVNGQNLNFIQKGRLVTIKCRFAGKYFGHNYAITNYDPYFDDETIISAFTIPRRIFTQLEERKIKWDIDWTKEDLECTWLAPERLLLYIQLAEPDWKMNISLKLNGKSLKVKKAYSSRTPGRLKMGKGHNTFIGFYVDFSDLKPDQKYTVEVTLPSSLKQGQLQGLFFENVETEYTDEIISEN